MLVLAVKLVHATFPTFDKSFPSMFIFDPEYEVNVLVRIAPPDVTSPDAVTAIMFDKLQPLKLKFVAFVVNMPFPTRIPWLIDIVLIFDRDFPLKAMISEDDVIVPTLTELTLDNDLPLILISGLVESTVVTFNVLIDIVPVFMVPFIVRSPILERLRPLNVSGTDDEFVVIEEAVTVPEPTFILVPTIASLDVMAPDVIVPVPTFRLVPARLPDALIAPDVIVPELTLRLDPTSVPLDVIAPDVISPDVIVPDPTLRLAAVSVPLDVIAPDVIAPDVMDPEPTLRLAPASAPLDVIAPDVMDPEPTLRLSALTSPIFDSVLPLKDIGAVASVELMLFALTVPLV